MRITGWFALTAAGGMGWFLAKGPPAHEVEECGRQQSLLLPCEVRSGVRDDPCSSRFTLHGQAFEGDGFFFIVDGGRSMLSSGGLERAKAAIIESVKELSPKTQFAIIVFDTGVHRFPASGQPAEASAAAKCSAVAWLRAVTGGCGTSIAEGFREALAFARRSSASKKVVIYTGDGSVSFKAEGKRLAEMISAENTEGVRIVSNDIGCLNPRADSALKASP
jgi:hypothetical protein